MLVELSRLFSSVFSSLELMVVEYEYGFVLFWVMLVLLIVMLLIDSCCCIWG